MERINSELVIPIKIYKKVVALLNVDSENLDAFDEVEISALTTLSDQIAIAIENINLFDATRRQLQELTVLHATAHAAVSAKSEDELLERATEVIGATLYPDKFGFLILDADTKTLHPHYSYRGIDKAQMVTVVPLGEGISGKVAASGEPWRLADVNEEPDYLKINPSMRSELCVPILGNDGHALGVINAESARVDNFTEGDMRLLSTIAGQLGTAIEKLRLFEAERLQRDQAQTLQQVAAILGAATDSSEILDLILDQLRHVVPFDSASIQIVNGDVMMLREVAGNLSKDAIGYELSIKDDKLAHPIIYDHKTVLYGDITDHPDWLKAPGASLVKSWIGAPLIVRGECLGVLTVDGYSANQFNEGDAQLVSSFAIHAGIALENTRLLEEARESLQREHRLNEMARAISDALNLETVLEDVVRLSCELVGTDASSLALVSPNRKQLEQPYHFYVEPEKARGLQTFPCGEDIAWQVINTGKALLLDDCRQYRHASGKSPIDKIYAFAGVPILVGEERIGCLMLYNLQPRREISRRDLELMQTVGRQAGIAIQNARLFEEIQSAYMETVSALANAIDVRDSYTSGHSQRLAELASETGALLNCSQQELEDIHWAALLHDIGKIGVPDEILRKPSTLDPFEKEIMRRHPEIGARIVEPVRKLESVAPIIRAHQEQYDGTGYPDGLKGDQIPLVARIISVADAYVAMTDDRVYRKARRPKDAILELKRCSGSQFDPKVVKAFLKVLKPRRKS
jgi:putative nucleotidyltransferase with HDIG domain